MILQRLQRIRVKGTVPTRDLPFIDAVAVLVALFAAYGIRAGISANYSFEWASVAPFVRTALPVSLCALLLSAAALGLYGREASNARAATHIAAAAYAAAVAAVIGIYWGGAVPPTAPLVLTATACLVVCVHLSRLLYWQVSDAERKPRESTSEGANHEASR